MPNPWVSLRRDQLIPVNKAMNKNEQVEQGLEEEEKICLHMYICAEKNNTKLTKDTGCQIPLTSWRQYQCFLLPIVSRLPDFSWCNMPKRVKMYHNEENIPNGHYISQMAGKLTKWTYNRPTSTTRT
jgi:hypothetical protein